ncbi:OB-fold domain-containing protein [Dehalococcoidia bacterium]|nr:OB-fold domain-containing protein [Dehalococcoidia bacterium]
MSYSKPLPIPDELSEPFWKAARASSLVIQRCQHCRYYSHPPENVCPNCRSLEQSFEFEPVSGRGEIKSWIVMRDAFLPGFVDELPFVIAVVELNEQPGLRMITRIMDGADASIEIGMPVRVVFEEVTRDITLPQFTLE